MRLDAPVQYSTIVGLYHPVFSTFSPFRTARAYRRTVRIAFTIRTVPVRWYARTVGVPQVWVFLHLPYVRTNGTALFDGTRYAWACSTHVWNGSNRYRCRTVQYRTVPRHIVRYRTVRYGTVQYESVRYGTVRYRNQLLYGTVWFGTGTVQYRTYTVPVPAQ